MVGPCIGYLRGNHNILLSLLIRACDKHNAYYQIFWYPAYNMNDSASTIVVIAILVIIGIVLITFK